MKHTRIKIQHLNIRIAAAVLIISLFVPFTALAYDQNDYNLEKEYTNALSGITFSKTTLDNAPDIDYVISEKKNVYKVGGASDRFYFCSTSNSGLSGFVDAAGLRLNEAILLFITFDNIKINGKKYWICVNYDKKKAPSDADLKNTDASIAFFLEYFTQNPTEDNLKVCAEKYLAPIVFSPTTSNRTYFDSSYVTTEYGKFKTNYGGGYAFPSQDPDASKLYHFSQDGECINCTDLTPATRNFSSIFKTAFDQQVCAVRLPDYPISGKCKWYICKYNAKNYTTQSEVNNALDKIAVAFAKEEAREEDLSEEEIEEITVPIIDRPGVSDGTAVSEKFKAEDPGSFTFKKLNKDPLSYINDYSFGKDTGAGELKGFAFSFYKLITTITIIGYAVALAAGAVNIMLRGPRYRDSFMNSMLEKTEALIAIGGAAGLIGMIITIIEVLK